MYVCTSSHAIHGENSDNTEEDISMCSIVHPESLRMRAQCELRVRGITPTQHAHYNACRFYSVRDGARASVRYAIHDRCACTCNACE